MACVTGLLNSFAMGRRDVDCTAADAVEVLQRVAQGNRRQYWRAIACRRHTARIPSRETGAVMNLTFEGRCWECGDNIACDGDMIPVELVYARETRPEVLKETPFTKIDAEFPAKVKAGDLIVAGKRFGSGHAHLQASYALAAAGVGVVAASVPRGNYRNLVNAGVPFLPAASAAVNACESGDVLRFISGIVVNLTRGVTVQTEPLAPMLIETIKLGGWKPMVRRRLEKMREVASG
ncbi:MAG: leuD2 [Gammaproteobacteria bacterium]|nr:leuD2 [Gammaproteobacteria bacterium]